MLLGVTVPNSGVLAAGDGLVGIAEHAERLGFDSVWTVDHVILPHISSQDYPYARQSGVTMPSDWPFLDPLVALAAVASRTSRVLLGTGVYLLPLRPPLINAKLAASVDVLSGGRLLLGVGLGWIKEEYEALDVSWEDRGRLLDEQIDLLRVLWREAAPTFQGRYFHAADFGMEPKPVNRSIPLLIGGKNDAARRRAAKRGDGWHLIDMEPSEIAAARAALAADCRACGRSPEAVPVSMYASIAVSSADVPEDERQFPLMGSVGQIAEKIRAYRDAGLDHLVFAARGLNTAVEYMALFDTLRMQVLAAGR
jgi:probable F420-dependent oxidoreductase